MPLASRYLDAPGNSLSSLSAPARPTTTQEWRCLERRALRTCARLEVERSRIPAAGERMPYSDEVVLPPWIASKCRSTWRYSRRKTFAPSGPTKRGLEVSHARAKDLRSPTVLR